MSADHLALDTADEVVELLRFEDIHLVCDIVSTSLTIFPLLWQCFLVCDNICSSVAIMICFFFRNAISNGDQA